MGRSVRMYGIDSASLQSCCCRHMLNSSVYLTSMLYCTSVGTGDEQSASTTHNSAEVPHVFSLQATVQDDLAATQGSACI